MSRDGCLELARRLGLDADDVVEWWLERSSVREFDGGLSRDDAEASALADARAHFEAVVDSTDEDADADALEAIDRGIDVGGSGRIAAWRMSTDEQDGIASGIVATMDADADADGADADADDGLGGDTILERPFRDDAVDTDGLSGDTIATPDELDGAIELADLAELRGATRKGPRSAPTQLELPFATKREHEH